MMTTQSRNGWHWAEWGAECIGTALLMFAVVSAKYLAVAAGPPCSGLRPRIAIVAFVAGLAVVAIALSPLGRRSGAHLNPAVTLGLWVQKMVGTADLGGYIGAQIIGGIAGFAAGDVWSDRVSQVPVTWAVIAPSINHVVSAAIEAGATALQLGVVFWLLLDSCRARWAAPAAAALLTTAIISLATISGAGFNPVRALAPDLVAGTYPGLWTFIVGSTAGAVLSGAMFVFLVGRRPLTGKLRHDPETSCYLACSLPHTAPAVHTDAVLRSTGAP